MAALRQRGVTPHGAQNTSGRRSAIDGRTTSWLGYDLSQRIRKRIEEIFGWMKTVGGFRRTRFRGLARTQLAGYLVASAYNWCGWRARRPSRAPPDPTVGFDGSPSSAEVLGHAFRPMFPVDLTRVLLAEPTSSSTC